MAFGDLFLEDVRKYRENQLKGTGIEPLFPLWGIPTGQLHNRCSQRVWKPMSEFVHFEPFSKLVIRHTEGLSPRDRVIEEIYELSEREARTFLTQTIHIENSGINIFWRLLIWIIQRWGKPTGKPYLATLRDIIEREVKRDSGQ